MCEATLVAGQAVQGCSSEPAPPQRRNDDREEDRQQRKQDIQHQHPVRLALERKPQKPLHAVKHRTMGWPRAAHEQL